MSSARLYYEAVQSILTETIAKGDPPSSMEIREKVFGAAFNSDSSKQQRLVYESIVEGRKRVLDNYARYIRSHDHTRDMAEIEYYKDDEMSKQVAHPDFGEFYSELKYGRFGDKTKVISNHLDAFVLVAAVWDRKVKEWSMSGDNLVIATSGPNSKWILPSWWKWAIRDTKLYLRTVAIMEGQFKRGMATGLITASGVPLKKALDYVGSVRGVLEDGTSWECECLMYNPGSANYCGNCGKAKPPSP